MSPGADLGLASRATPRSRLSRRSTSGIRSAALAAIEQLQPAGYQSLGTRFDVRHIAAMPVGMKVRATAAVTRIESRTVTFRVEAHDEKELIGDGTHERVVVNVEKFDARIRKKLRMER